MIGRRIDGVDAVVVDAAERAAYCVAGHPDTVVVTSAALDSLTDRNLQAVLAHERAHLAGRHHHVLAFVRALAVAIPGCPCSARPIERSLCCWRWPPMTPRPADAVR